ncbi:MAG: hypothetical protein QM504_01225 [Pseudomonadota bacterium]
MYTAYTNKNIDNQIDAHMQSISHKLSNILGDDLYSIVLTGGFGRGEGSILINTIDNKDTVKIINDYDFEIVYKSYIGELPGKIYMKLKYAKKISQLETELANEIDIKQLDFTLKSLTSYKSDNHPKLADYDTKYGHIIIYGDNDPTLLMPQYNASDIPPFEGSWLLRNRGIGLLLAYFYLAREKTPDCQATDNFYIEINKALLAMGDALFILYKNYHHSYQQRLDTIDELLKNSTFSRISELIKFYKIAAEHKLRPKDNTFDNFEVTELWNLVVNLYIDLFIYYESERFNTKFKDLNDYVSQAPIKATLSTKNKLRLLFELITKKIKLDNIALASVIRDKSINLGFTMSLLAILHNEKKYENLTNNVKKYSDLPDTNCIEISKRYLLLSHPSGELQRFLNK